MFEHEGAAAASLLDFLVYVDSKPLSVLFLDWLRSKGLKLDPIVQTRLGAITVALPFYFPFCFLSGAEHCFCQCRQTPRGELSRLNVSA